MNEVTSDQILVPQMMVSILRQVSAGAWMWRNPAISQVRCLAFMLRGSRDSWRSFSPLKGMFRLVFARNFLPSTLLGLPISMGRGGQPKVLVWSLGQNTVKNVNGPFADHELDAKLRTSGLRVVWILHAFSFDNGSSTGQYDAPIQDPRAARAQSCSGTELVTKDEMYLEDFKTERFMSREMGVGK